MQVILDLQSNKNEWMRIEKRAEAIRRNMHRLCEQLNRIYVNYPSERPQISSPAIAAELFQPFLASLDHEELWIALLDTQNRVCRLQKLYQGTLNSSAIRVAEIFRGAILNNAAAIIIAHNHPSGNLTPSNEDISTTRAIVAAGKLLDILVEDHLIIGGGRWVSIREQQFGIW